MTALSGFRVQPCRNTGLVLDCEGGANQIRIVLASWR